MPARRVGRILQLVQPSQQVVTLVRRLYRRSGFRAVRPLASPPDVLFLALVLRLPRRLLCPPRQVATLAVRPSRQALLGKPSGSHRPTRQRSPACSPICVGAILFQTASVMGRPIGLTRTAFIRLAASCT